MTAASSRVKVAVAPGARARTVVGMKTHWTHDKRYPAGFLPALDWLNDMNVQIPTRHHRSLSRKMPPSTWMYEWLGRYPQRIFLTIRERENGTTQVTCSVWFARCMASHFYGHSLEERYLADDPDGGDTFDVELVSLTCTIDPKLVWRLACLSPTARRTALELREDCTDDDFDWVLACNIAEELTPGSDDRTTELPAFQGKPGRVRFTRGEVKYLR